MFLGSYSIARLRLLEEIRSLQLKKCMALCITAKQSGEKVMIGFLF